jgi:hypothetical protein
VLDRADSDLLLCRGGGQEEEAATAHRHSTDIADDGGF